TAAQRGWFKPSRPNNTSPTAPALTAGCKPNNAGFIVPQESFQYLLPFPGYTPRSLRPLPAVGIHLPLYQGSLRSPNTSNLTPVHHLVHRGCRCPQYKPYHRRAFLQIPWEFLPLSRPLEV